MPDRKRLAQTNFEASDVNGRKTLNYRREWNSWKGLVAGFCTDCNPESHLLHGSISLRSRTCL